MNKSNWPTALIGVSFGILAALVIAPVTRWIVVPHLKCAVGVTAGIAGVAQTPAAIPTELANQLQPRLFVDEQSVMNAQIRNTSPDTRDIQAMAIQYPDNAAIRAAAIACKSSRATIDRPDLEQTTQASPHKFASPTAMADILRNAEAGEHIAPANGYFNVIRASALFSMHRDSEALAEVHRAADQRKWDDYADNALYGGWRVNEAINGTRVGLADVTTCDRIVEPFWIIRAAGRMSVAYAKQLEAAGNRDAGLAIRLDVLKCGSLMRNRSHQAIGQLVGQAIEQAAIMTNDPKTYKRTPDESNEDWMTYLKGVVDKYLISTRHPQYKPTIDRELGSMAAQRNLLAEAVNASTGHSQSATQRQIATECYFWLFTGLSLMAICGLLIYTTIIRLARPKMHGSRSGYAVGILVVTGGYLASFNGHSTDVTAQWTCITVALVSAIATALIGRIRGVFGRRQAYDAVIVAIAWAITVAFGTWQTSRFYAGFDTSTMTVFGQQLRLSDWDEYVSSALIFQGLAIGISAVIGCLTARGEGFALGRGAVIVGTLIVVGYAGCILYTASLDRRLDTYVRSYELNELAYYAKQTGTALPAPTDWSALRY